MIIQKVIANVPKEEMDLIREACKADKRSISSLARKSMVNEAKKILEAEKKPN